MEFPRSNPILGTKEILPLADVRLIKDHVLVAPLYEADSVKGIVIPDSAKNPQSQQGYVVASGPQSEFTYPDRVVYRPFLADTVPLGDFEYLNVPNVHIVCKIQNDVLVPRKGHILVEPDWDTSWERKRGTLYLVDPGIEGPNVPPREGVVTGTGSGCREVMIGDRVLIPQKGGTVVAFKDHNVYLIPEALIEGLVERPS